MSGRGEGATEAGAVPDVGRGALVAGEWVTATSGGTMSLVDPATGRVAATVAACDAADVEAAVAGARAAFAAGGWSRRAPRERAAVLLRLADLVERDAEALAAWDSADSGRPITELRTGDLPGAVESIRWFAEAVDKRYGDVSPAGPGHHLAFTQVEPLGAVAAVLPWNYPLAMTAWKLAPALAVGNSLLLKPADATPRSALHLASLAQEAGVPDGVLSVLPGTGPGAGAALAGHGGVAALSFTGSTATGRSILRAAADSNFKRVTLEMGGKSPQVLFADALDVGDALIDGLVEAAFLSMGQNCTAGSRILVHASIADEVTQRFVERARSLVIGPPADPATQVGPLVSAAARDRVAGLVDRALAAGATLLTGGGPVLAETGGAYYPPTVLAGVAADAELERAEVFGPVVTISTFVDEGEAVARANDTEYGLAASVWTRDIDRALRVASATSAGTVSVNAYSEGDITTPFGGFGSSGFGGKEKSLAAFAQWTREKTVWIARTGA